MCRVNIIYRNVSDTKHNFDQKYQHNKDYITYNKYITIYIYISIMKELLLLPVK